MHGTSWIMSSVLAVVLSVALAAPAVAAMPDAWITTKTKLALLTTDRGRPALAFLCAQTINVFLTLLLAWLLFGGVIFAQPAIR